MATLSQLPNETITEIWGHILELRDLESFAMVSKQIYAKCGPLVKEHNRLKREYSVFETGPNTRASAPAILLKSVLLKPRLALYVIHLSIGRHEVRWQDPDHNGDDDIPYSKECPKTRHTPYPDEDMALFFDIIRKFIARPKVFLHWNERIMAGDEDAILALLSLVLTRLTRITLKSPKSEPGHPFAEAIDCIAKDGQRNFLARLATVDLHIPSRASDEDPDGEWYCLKRFATLPTVKSLHVKGLGAMENDDVPNGEQFFIPGTSNITELTFVESGVGPKTMFALLESFIDLKRFSYVKPREDSFHVFEPFWMRAALLANAKHSLEFLRIASSKGLGLLGDLRGFTALRELETNVNLLVVGQARERDDELADLLPPSIEKLCLHTLADMAMVPVLVETFRHAKLRHLRKLGALKLSTEYEFGATPDVFRRNFDFLEASVAKCRDVGIELTIFTQRSPAKEEVGVQS